MEVSIINTLTGGILIIDIKDKIKNKEIAKVKLPFRYSVESKIPLDDEDENDLPELLDISEEISQQNKKTKNNNYEKKWKCELFDEFIISYNTNKEKADFMFDDKVKMSIFKGSLYISCKNNNNTMSFLIDDTKPNILQELLKIRTLLSLNINTIFEIIKMKNNN